MPMTFDDWCNEFGQETINDWGTPREVAVLLPYEIAELLRTAYDEYCEQEQEYLEMQMRYSEGLGV
jgi:hypothetical protein